VNGGAGGPGSPRVLHVVTGLGPGGAERTLATLVPRLGRSGWRSTVVTLGATGVFASTIAEADVEVVALGMPPGRPTVAGLAGLIRAVRRIRPSIVQGWMYHGNLGASVAGAIARAPVFWNVRQSLGSPETERPATEIVIRLGARLSPSAARIVYNSIRAARQHESIGYADGGRAIVPNGFDTVAFRPDPCARDEIRRSLGIASDAPVAGCVARVHPVKDHAGLLEAFRRVRAVRPDARLVLIGAGTDRLPEGLELLAARAGGRDGVLGLGEREDLPRLVAAFDLAVLASRAEAFPNALGEAMACGVPCVATAVGEVEALVGTTGRVVPPGRPDRLAEAWLAAIAEGPEAAGARSRAARLRIETRFDLDAAVESYDRLYSAALDRLPV
jgi:glycosyltransferase involved in cell wall biosynthesis